MKDCAQAGRVLNPREKHMYNRTCANKFAATVPHTIIQIAINYNTPLAKTTA